MNEPDIPKINDEIARKFRKIKADLAARRSAVELFEALLAKIETEFGIPFVWLSLIRLPETAGLLKSLEASTLLATASTASNRRGFWRSSPMPLPASRKRRSQALLPSAAAQPKVFHQVSRRIADHPPRQADREHESWRRLPDALQAGHGHHPPFAPRPERLRPPHPSPPSPADLLT